MVNKSIGNGGAMYGVGVATWAANLFRFSELAKPHDQALIIQCKLWVSALTLTAMNMLIS
ncbi:hypothetical protein AT727_05765 [Desulfitobacterium hafniense]|uniref:Uncharacterized protein n=1 Tax=Desulfitobacterium hafniense TaxID=49338 RepID=A0A0W1JH75_DESHA|nr:hypothetical protein [Desulfitobacterium hafniense]KTE91105.1 hypothetical protein AT727_05765 [Desulfitobacterium hafniense]